MFSRLRMLLDDSIELMAKRKSKLALMKDAGGHRFVQSLMEAQSMKEMMKLKDKRYTEFQNEMNLMKMLIKAQGQKHAQFQNAVDSAKNTIKKEIKYHTELRDKIDSKKMAMERKYLIPVKRTAHLSASKQPGVRMRQPRKPCNVASMSTAQKMKVAISEVQVGLMPSQISRQ
jgi:hypothetical protein